MQLLTLFGDENEARMSHDLLATRGIASRIIGAKEYTAHVLGGGAGRFELWVDADDVPEARKILDAIAARSHLGEFLPPNYFKRSLVFACAAIPILPGLFNLVSITNAYYFWRTSDRDLRSALQVAFLTLLQLPGFAALYFLLRYWHS